MGISCLGGLSCDEARKKKEKLGHLIAFVYEYRNYSSGSQFHFKSGVALKNTKAKVKDTRLKYINAFIVYGKVSLECMKSANG